MCKYTTLLISLLLVSCTQKYDCFTDQDGLIWTNERLMKSFDHKRDTIGGDVLCYPNTGLVHKQLARGKPCPNLRQQIVTERHDGQDILVCRCKPKPDILFTEQEIRQWCNNIKK